MTISTSARREVVEQAQRAAVEAITATAALHGAYSITDGALRNAVMDLVPHAQWQAMPNPEYRHWHFFGLTEETAASEAIQSLGRVERANWSSNAGPVYYVHPFEKHGTIGVTEAWPLVNAALDAIRTPEQARLWQLYWKAYEHANGGDRGALRAMLADLAEALQNCKAA